MHSANRQIDRTNSGLATGRIASSPLAPVLFLVAALCLTAAAKAELVVVAVRVEPAEVAIQSGHTAQLLVTGETAEGELIDLTHAAEFGSSDASVASVGETGVVRAAQDGRATITIAAGGKTALAIAVVSGAQRRTPPDFANDVVPLLSRFGCNSSGCHGKAEGKNGFKLSVFGFDPDADYRALVMEGRGRRLFPAAPERSLVLRKVSGGIPHGGGVLISSETPYYRTLLDWVSAGAPRGTGEPRVERIEVSPQERLLQMGTRQQLRVVARMSDGTTRDVTALATYVVNNEDLAIVDATGRVDVKQAPGVVAVMASYLDQMDVFQAVVPQRGQGIEFANWPVHNYIDQHVNRRLAQLNIAPSPQAGDADYLRRVYLDVIGTQPTVAEARAFLDDTRPDKRARLVDALLQREEFADYWALKWADLLRVNRLQLGHKAAYDYYRWIRDSVAANRPLDAFATEIVSASGPLRERPAGNFFKAVDKPNAMADVLSQVFLGVRIECAQCHHHPFDRWGQDDYYGMQAFFTQVAFKATPRGEALAASKDAKTVHPRHGYAIFARPLGEPAPKATEEPAQVPIEGDRRVQLADWMTSPENPFFARSLANRVWAHFLGRGIVEPVDDFRRTNPPTNAALLDSLAVDLVESGYDMRHLIRAITASAAYQRSAATNETNLNDTQNYSRFPLKPLPAEVLLDAVTQVTGVGEKFSGMPSGTRAIQLWDSEVGDDFLKLFGRPTRASSCECERVSEPTVGQVLYLLNSQRIQEKLSDPAGSVRALVERHAENEPLVEELYLTFYSRRPTAQERQAALAHLASQPDRRQAVEDLAWSMLNSLEFVFNH